MNKNSYRIIYSKARQMFVAVAEKVYKNIKKDDLFTNDLTQNLNC
ncbi:ESPR domain-containing protein, partial [Acinetobacter baumannii]